MFELGLDRVQVWAGLDDVHVCSAVHVCGRISKRGFVD